MKIRFRNSPFGNPLWNLVCMARPTGKGKPNPINSIGRSNQLLHAGKIREGLAVLEEVVLEPIRANAFDDSYHVPLMRLVILYDTTDSLTTECAGKALAAERYDALSEILTQAAMMLDVLQSREPTMPERWMLKVEVGGIRKLQPGRLAETRIISLDDFAAMLTRVTGVFESVSAGPAAAKAKPAAKAAPKAEPPAPAPKAPAPEKKAKPPKPKAPAAPEPVAPSPAPAKPKPATWAPGRPLSEIPVHRLAPPAPKPKPEPEPEPVPVLTETQQKAQMCWRSGKGMLDSKRFKEAIPHFRRALEIDPGNEEAQAGLNACADGLVALARDMSIRGQKKGARKLFAQAESARPKDGAVVERLEELRGSLGTPEAPQPAAPPPASTLTTSVAEAVAPPPAEAPEQKLRKAIAENTELRELYARLEESPNDVLVMRDIATVLHGIGFGEEAAQQIEQARSLSPKHIDLLCTAISLYGKMRWENDRLLAIVALLNASPDHLYAFSQLGFHYLSLGERVYAWCLFEHVLDLNPADRQATDGLQILKSSGMKAPEEYASISTILEDTFARARSTQGHMATEKARSAQARGEDVQTLIRKGVLHMGAGKLAEATDYLLAAKEKDNKNQRLKRELSKLFGYLRARARELEAIDVLEDAREVCELALRIRNGDQEMFAALQRINIELSRRERAAQPAPASPPPPPEPAEGAKAETEAEAVPAPAAPEPAPKPKGETRRALLARKKRLIAAREKAIERGDHALARQLSEAIQKIKETEAEQLAVTTEEEDEVIAILLANPGMSVTELRRSFPRIQYLLYVRKVFPGGIKEARAAAEEAKRRAETEHLRIEVIEFLLAHPGITSQTIMQRHGRILRLLYREKVFPGGIREARAAAAAYEEGKKKAAPKPIPAAPKPAKKATPTQPAPQKRKKVGRPPLTPEQIARKRQVVIDWLTADPERIGLSGSQIRAADAEIARIISNRRYFASLANARAAAEAFKKQKEES